jgi:hypothetical protein
MAELIGGWTLLLGVAGSLAYLVFAAIRGWWRLCQSLDLELWRGWKVNVPWAKVPWLFVACLTGPLLEAPYLGRYLIHRLIHLVVAWVTGPWQ